MALKGRFALLRFERFWGRGYNHFFELWRTPTPIYPSGCRQSRICALGGELDSLRAHGLSAVSARHRV